MSDPTSILSEAVSSGEISAATLTVMWRGQTVLSKGFGRLRPDDDSPLVDGDSLFPIASVTKPVTACALMRLVERGAVSLEEAVCNYLPEFTGDGREQVRVRHLLSHTSGMPNMLRNNVSLRKARAPLSAFVEGALRAELLFFPGTEFRYQSMGILLAAEIVERISRKRLRDLLREDIFEPLGMTRSALGLGDFRNQDTVWSGAGPVESEACDSWGPNSVYWRDQGHPWGGMHSTGNDLAQFLHAMLNGGGSILDAETVKEMICDQNPKLNAPWGLGWGLRDSLVWTPFGDRVSRRTFGHQGSTGTVAWADPDGELCCVVLTNENVDEGRLLIETSEAVCKAFV